MYFYQNKNALETAHTSIRFTETGYFSKIICDYLNEDEKTAPFFHRFPTIENFKGQIEDKKKSFPKASREILKSSLIEQYDQTEISAKSRANIEQLRDENTFTITTGHQLNLFTGPLYFLYKIISAINLTKELKEAYPEYNFVPVYWMATEDHDFEEINYFNFKSEKIAWNKEVLGAVGRSSLEGLNEVYDHFSTLIGPGINGETIREMFQKSYLEKENLAQATRYLANELFGDRGLLIIDGDDQRLKKLFSPYVKRELREQVSDRQVEATNEQLRTNYKVQVNQREINLFYLDHELRERIVLEDGKFRINNTGMLFSAAEIESCLDNSPEKFSPNVIMRPLYQEVILPNLCYIGGGGELAYWMQLKTMFQEFDIPYPILLLRNSVLLINQKQLAKMGKLKISIDEIFMDQSELIKMKVNALSSVPVDFSKEKKDLKEMFRGLKSLSDQTDPSFSGAVLAQEKKQLNGLEKLEKRLLKAKKRKYAELVSRISALQDELFPNRSLQERQANFSEFFERYGPDLITVLLQNLSPLDQDFDVLLLKS